MRNQAFSQWQLIDSAADRREDAWNLDRQAGLRAWLTGGVVLLGICVITIRLGMLQTVHQPAFLTNANPLTERSEDVPAMDGRIYSSDGQVLAYDHQRFAVAVHYRWLQDPPDSRWLRQQARSRLTRSRWSNKEAMDQARQEVLDEQAALWTRLAKISGQTTESLQLRRQEIQKRVERIAESVRKRQIEREETKTAEQQVPASSSGSRWERFWQFIVAELTEPPERESRDPIIIREELDYHELVPEIPVKTVAQIEAHPRDFPGVQILARTQRIYPQQDLAAHVIGNRTAIREEALQERKQELNQGDPLSYRQGDRRGRFGVERSYDVTLRGLPGARKLTRNRRGEVIRTEMERESRSGQHLVLSMHSQLQKTAEELLDRKVSPPPSLIPPLPANSAGVSNQPPTAGCLLVMNLYSGELLAAATSPRPDLTKMTSGDADYWKQLTTDPRSPLLSRITQVPIVPGSTFKPLTAIALCETSGTTDHPFVCQGFLDNPKSHRCAIYQSSGVGHGELDLSGAMARSCNVFFFSAARQLGPEPLVRWSKLFRFGESTGVDLPFEQAGHVPSSADNASGSNHKWYPGDNLGLSIGQSYLTVTPLQMLVMISAIANGGELVTPSVVSRVLSESEQGEISSSLEQPVSKRSKRVEISPETLSVVRGSLREVVSNPRGTAFASVNSTRVAISGKTGTAQAGGNRPNHAWFVGYAPAQAPQVAFVVCLEHGGAGGEQAGPLAKAIVERMVELELITAQ